MDFVAANLAAIRARINQACHAAGRDPSEVKLLAVSKAQTVELIQDARAAGQHWFAENKAQELAGKAEQLAGAPDLKWVMIGHLQKNKAALVARHATQFQALDSLGLASVLERRLEQLGRELDVLIQVNSSGEESKFGLSPEQVPRFVEQLLAYPRLRVQGLMTIASREDPAGCFQRTREVRQHLLSLGLPGAGYPELSMGMSGDFELAIACGATQVRVGTAIFGARNYPAPDPEEKR